MKAQPRKSRPGTKVRQPPPRLKAVAAGSARERILRAALRQFAEDGFAGATTAEIARRAGVTHPLVHYHFPTKDDLWQAAVAQVFSELGRDFADVLPELRALGSRQQLESLVRRFVRFSAAHPEVVQLMIREGSHDGPRLRSLLERHFQPLLGVMDGVLRQGQSEGWAKPLLAQHVLLLVIPAAAYIFSAPALVQRVFGTDTRTPATIEAHADTLVEVIFHGLER